MNVQDPHHNQPVLVSGQPLNSAIEGALPPIQLHKPPEVHERAGSPS